MKYSVAFALLLTTVKAQTENGDLTSLRGRRLDPPGQSYDCDLGCGLDVVGHGPPVCGVNGVTYFNECFAVCQDIDIERNGVCPGGPQGMADPNDDSYVREGMVTKGQLNAFKNEKFSYTAKRRLLLIALDENEGLGNGNGNPGNGNGSPGNGNPGNGNPGNGQGQGNCNGQGQGNPNCNGPKASRITPDGDEYAATEIDFGEDGVGEDLDFFFGEEGAINATGANDDGQRDLSIVPDPGDDRVRITGTRNWPYRTIGMLRGECSPGSSSTCGCTGTVIYNNAVLTAGHCVSTGTGKWKDIFYFVPGKSGSYEPYGRFDWSSITTYSAYHYRRNSDYDIAVIRTRSQSSGKHVGDRVGYEGWRWTSNVGARAWHLADSFIAGYPCDKPSGQMWSSQVPPSKQSWVDSPGYNYLVGHKHDTFGCMSGSPVISDRDPERLVLGVHFMGLGGPQPSGHNGANLIHDSHYWKLLKWSGRS